MIDARHPAVWYPWFLGLRLRSVQGNVGFLSANVHPSVVVPTCAFAAYSKFRKRGLQETGHPLDVTYRKVSMFKSNSHCTPPERPHSHSGRPFKNRHGGHAKNSTYLPFSYAAV